jgi:hypothetical protein
MYKSKTPKTPKKSGKPKSSYTRKTTHLKKCKDDIDCSIANFREQNYANQIWNTCIKYDGKTYHILYVTPTNVIIKSTDTFQVPIFVAKMNLARIECNIAFTPVCNESFFRFSFRGTKRCNKKHYVSCFLRNCGTWYVVMIQAYSLWYNVFLFYKIKHVKNLLNRAGELIFKPDMFMNLTADSIPKELTLNPKYLEEIMETSPIFDLLHKFLFEKDVANFGKIVVADVVASEAFDIATGQFRSEE